MARKTPSKKGSPEYLKAVALVDEGMSVPKAAKACGISDSMLYRATTKRKRRPKRASLIERQRKYQEKKATAPPSPRTAAELRVVKLEETVSGLLRIIGSLMGG